jgi:murein DD-endopeptidase MepM/ murein hydrolase activator NlpD
MTLIRALAAFLLFCWATSVAVAHIELTVKAPKQGETIELSLIDDGGTTAADQSNAIFLAHDFKLFAHPKETGEKEWRALIAIPADLKPGHYQIKTGNESTTVTVCDGGFPVQRLTLPNSKDNFDMSPGEKAAIEGAKKTVSAERLWQGKFLPPSNAKRSASFGLKRIVNRRLLKDYYHSGLDFAAGLGSPVKACAGGKVVLARTGFKLHGNVVAIDHGQGVVSFYIHLQKILVEQDEIVEAGDKIGTVGQTGRATGPHLHFSIYVNETATNPVCWFAKDY